MWINIFVIACWLMALATPLIFYFNAERIAKYMEKLGWIKKG